MSNGTKKINIKVMMAGWMIFVVQWLFQNLFNHTEPKEGLEWKEKSNGRDILKGYLTNWNPIYDWKAFPVGFEQRPLVKQVNAWPLRYQSFSIL